MKHFFTFIFLLTSINSNAQDGENFSNTSFKQSLSFIGISFYKAAQVTLASPLEMIKTKCQLEPGQYKGLDLFKSMIKKPLSLYQGSGPFFISNLTKALGQGQLLCFYEELYKKAVPKELHDCILGQSLFGALVLGSYNMLLTTAPENLKSLQMTLSPPEAKHYTLSNFLKSPRLSLPEKLTILSRGSSLVFAEGTIGWLAFLYCWNYGTSRLEDHYGKDHVPFLAKLGLAATVPFIDVISTQPWQTLKTRLQAESPDKELVRRGFFDQLHYTYRKHGIIRGFYPNMGVTILFSTFLCAPDIVGMVIKKNVR